MKQINNKKRIPKNICKVFMLSSAIGAVLMSHNNGEPKLTRLLLQINRAMKVFGWKSGKQVYVELTNEVQHSWNHIVEKFDGTIPEEEINAFIAYMCMIVPEKDFYEFLGMSPYITENKIEDKKLEVELIYAVLQFDNNLNKYLGTKPYAIKLTSIAKPKVKKLRDKPKTKQVVEKKVSNAKLKKSAERKQKQQLRKMIAAARLKKKEIS